MKKWLYCTLTVSVMLMVAVWKNNEDPAGNGEWLGFAAIITADIMIMFIIKEMSS